MTTIDEKREQLNTIRTAIVELLETDQAERVGIEDVGTIDEVSGLQAVIGFTHEGDAYFVTIDPA